MEIECLLQNMLMAEPIIHIRADDIPLVRFVRTMQRKVFRESLENAVFRGFQTKLDNSGYGTIHVGPDNAAMEWDIYQISTRTSQFSQSCIAEVLHNTFFLCGTPVGWKDTATGPPDTVLRPGDEIVINFYYGNAKDLATVGIWYNENPVGTTTSTAH